MKKEANEGGETEIDVLKQRVDELGDDINKYIIKRDKRIEKLNRLNKKENRGYVKILVILVILLIVVDVISLVAYYNPDFSNMFKFNMSSSNNPNTSGTGTGPGKCSDGTPEAACSKNKPYFCYTDSLIKSARMCGCPPGYVQDFQDCVKS